MLLFCIIWFVQAQGRMLCIKNRTWNSVFMFMTWTKFSIFGNFLFHSLCCFFIDYLIAMFILIHMGYTNMGFFSIGVSQTLVFSLN